MIYKLTELHEKLGRAFISAFRDVPSGTTSLDVSQQDFSRHTGKDLAAAFRLIPKSVLKLNISSSRFSPAALAEGLRALGETDIVEIDLSDIGLDSLKPSELFSVSAALAIIDLKTLYLRSNGLGRIESSSLDEFFRYLNKDLEALYLDKNELGLQSSETLSNICVQLSELLVHLSLQDNLLDRLVDDLMDILDLLEADRIFEWVDISLNRLSAKTSSSLKERYSFITVRELPKSKMLTTSTRLFGRTDMTSLDAILEESEEDEDETSSLEDAPTGCRP